MGFSAPLKQSLIPRRVISSWGLGGGSKALRGRQIFTMGCLQKAWAHTNYTNVWAHKRKYTKMYIFVGFSERKNYPLFCQNRGYGWSKISSPWGASGGGGRPPPPLRRWGRSPPLITPFLTPTSKERIKGSKKYMSWHFFFITVNDFFWGGATLFESPPPAKYKADARGRDVHTFSNSFLFHFAFFPLFLLFLSFFFLFFWCPRGCARGHAPPLAPPSYGTGKTTENIN